MSSKRTRKQAPPEDTYTTEDMLDIIHKFATHVARTYELYSRRLHMKMDITPEAMIKIWQNELEHEVTTN